MQKSDTAPKITVHQTSEAVTQHVNQPEIVTAGAMAITVKKPGVLAQYRIVEVVGDSAKNEVYMGMVMPLLWVTEIDGEPVPPPGTKRELEALIQRLGEDGVSALMTHIQSRPAATPSDEAVKN